LLRIDDRDELTTVWHVFFSGEYSVPANACSILDLGANIGAFAVWAAEKFPQARIWSVEPFPSTFDRLKDNLGRNNFGDRVSCEQLAVCGKDGVVRFDATEGKRSYCRTILSETNSADTPSIEVLALCLKSLLDRLDIDQLDCLKMDVEGAEYEILLNADSSTLKRIKVITMEYHDESKTPPLWHHLEHHAFHRVWQVSAGWSGLACFKRND
jgi:FkbM family methyltransferase